MGHPELKPSSHSCPGSCGPKFHAESPVAPVVISAFSHIMAPTVMLPKHHKALFPAAFTNPLYSSKDSRTKPEVLWGFPRVHQSSGPLGRADASLGAFPQWVGETRDGGGSTSTLSNAHASQGCSVGGKAEGLGGRL